MIIHVLFAIGILLTVVGWFFEHAKGFKWLISLISSDYVFAKEGLNDLEKDPKIALLKCHEGFLVLVNKWPNLQDKESVEYIGRGPAYIALGSKVKNDIQIIAYDKERKEIRERWSMSDARSTIENLVDKKLFWIGGVLFWSGILVAVLSYIQV